MEPDLWCEVEDLVEELELSSASLRMVVMSVTSSVTSQLHCSWLAPTYADILCKRYPEELAQRRVVWLARLALDVFQIFGEPESKHLQHAIEGFIGVADGCEGFGAVEVVPILEVGCWLEELGRQREADGGYVFYADESGRRISVWVTLVCKNDMRPSRGLCVVRGMKSPSRALRETLLDIGHWTLDMDPRIRRATYFLKIPKNMRSFDVSSGGLSVTTCVAGTSGPIEDSGAGACGASTRAEERDEEAMSYSSQPETKEARYGDGTSLALCWRGWDGRPRSVCTAIINDGVEKARRQLLGGEKLLAFAYMTFGLEISWLAGCHGGR